MKWILRSLLAVVVGLVASDWGGQLGWKVGVAWGSGALTPWQRLPDLPAGAREIKGGSTHAVLVEAEDGRAYLCELGSDACWTSAGGSEQLETESPECQGDFGWYSDVSAPPQGTVDQLKTRWCLPSLASTEVDYAVTAEGRVWYWSQSDGESMPLFRLLAPVLAGIVIGFFAGIIVVVLVFLSWDRRAARNRALSSHDAPKA